MRLFVGALCLGLSQGGTDVPATTSPAESKASVDARLHLVSACPEVTTKCGVPKSETADIPALAAALDCMLKVDITTVPPGPCHEALEVFLNQHNVNSDARGPAFPQGPRPFPMQPPMQNPQNLLILMKSDDDDDQDGPADFKPSFPWARGDDDEPMDDDDEPFGMPHGRPWFNSRPGMPSPWMSHRPPFMPFGGDRPHMPFPPFWMHGPSHGPMPFPHRPMPFWMDGEDDERPHRPSTSWRHHKSHRKDRDSDKPSWKHGKESGKHGKERDNDDDKRPFWMHGKEDRRPGPEPWEHKNEDRKPHMKRGDDEDRRPQMPRDRDEDRRPSMPHMPFDRRSDDKDGDRRPPMPFMPFEKRGDDKDERRPPMPWDHEKDHDRRPPMPHMPFERPGDKDDDRRPPMPYAWKDHKRDSDKEDRRHLLSRHDNDDDDDKKRWSHQDKPHMPFPPMHGKPPMPFPPKDGEEPRHPRPPMPFPPMGGDDKPPMPFPPKDGEEHPRPPMPFPPMDGDDKPPMPFPPMDGDDDFKMSLLMKWKHAKRSEERDAPKGHYRAPQKHESRSSRHGDDDDFKAMTMHHSPRHGRESSPRQHGRESSKSHHSRSSKFSPKSRSSSRHSFHMPSSSSSRWHQRSPMPSHFPMPSQHTSRHTSSHSSRFSRPSPLEAHFQSHFQSHFSSPMSHFQPQMSHFQPQMSHFQPRPQPGMSHFQPQMSHFQPQMSHFQPQMPHFQPGMSPRGMPSRQQPANRPSMMLMMMPKMSMASQGPMSFLQNAIQSRPSNGAGPSSDYDYDYDYAGDYDYDDDSSSQPSLLGSLLQQMTAKLQPPSELLADTPAVEITPVQNDASESVELDASSTESADVPVPTQPAPEVSHPSKRAHNKEQTEQVSYRNAP